MRRFRVSALAAAAGILLQACANRYGDFALPPPAGPAPAAALPLQPQVLIPRPGAQLAPIAGTWESVDVLNPSVVDLGGGKLINVYSAYDGRTWHTGVARSLDHGATWSRLGRALSPDPATWEGSYIAANGSALARPGGGEIRYWYQAGHPPRIGLARSPDAAVTWTKHPEPVLPTGPRGSWDERGVADPYVIEAAGDLYMFYLGQNRARRQRLGLARSRDGGFTWEKLRSGPILDVGVESTFDENGLGEPAVWQSHGRWWMLYTGRDRHEVRRLGLAFSRDGRRWERFTESAIMAGAEPWNAKVVCDPTILPPLAPGAPWRFWYGGGDVPHPAENIHGRIGYAELRMTPAQ